MHELKEIADGLVFVADGLVFVADGLVFVAASHVVAAAPASVWGLQLPVYEALSYCSV